MVRRRWKLLLLEIPKVFEAIAWKECLEEQTGPIIGEDDFVGGKQT
jgi:hypothetical protein